MWMLLLLQLKFGKVFHTGDCWLELAKAAEFSGQYDTLSNEEEVVRKLCCLEVTVLTCMILPYGSLSLLSQSTDYVRVTTSAWNISLVTLGATVFAVCYLNSTGHVLLPINSSAVFDNNWLASDNVFARYLNVCLCMLMLYSLFHGPSCLN